MTTPSAKSQFLLLLRQPSGGTPPLEELKKIMALFEAWMKSLRAKRMVVGTNGLEGTGKVLRGSHGLSVTDGPYAETHEIIGGYVLIEADNLEAAVDAARNCPGLGYQMTVEVRPIRPMSGG
jgi:hypothetical protein